ncbi:hypothetical protein [Oribacterium sp. oral taxon 108]|uniref:hypothetical protein n=1 Tax=Oribacterium sp. oral taxon 108 TaxID=712414 RepID=UPI001584D07A|nr:hypothetical protein [Oribacterium sp. oral taxon 108]
MNSIRTLGDNVKVLARDESHAILEVKDESGEGIMTIYTPFVGVYINICDMHMRRCRSGFFWRKMQMSSVLTTARRGGLKWRLWREGTAYSRKNSLGLMTGDIIAGMYLCHLTISMG